MVSEKTNSQVLAHYLDGCQELLDSLPQPVSVHDPDFNVVMANRRLKEIIGEIDPATPVKCHELFHCRPLPIADCPMQKALQSGEAASAEIYEPSLEKYLVVQAAPIIIDGNIIGVTHSITDVTALKASAEAYKKMAATSSEAIIEIKRRETALQRSRDAFLNMLEDISDSYKELEKLFLGLTQVMVNAIDAKSPWTRGHSVRVAEYATQIGREMGLEDEEVDNLRIGGLLHDVGKIGTYDYLLDKPERLSDDEFDVIRKHPVQGAKILQNIEQLAEVIPSILYHHERIDGRGYPQGLKGEAIPLGARILHVADSFDAMLADRPYRPSPGKEYAVAELRKWSGTQFDAEVVEAFLRVLARRTVNN